MDNAQDTKLTERQKYWLNHLRSCEAEGLSIAAYAKVRKLNLQTMYTSKAALISKGLLSKPHPRSQFKRAQIQPSSVPSHWRVQLPNGINVVFDDPTDAVGLTSVLQVTTQF